MDYAVINIATKTIENVIVLEEDSQWTPPNGTQIVPLVIGFGIDDTWDGVNFTNTIKPDVEAIEVTEPIDPQQA